MGLDWDEASDAPQISTGPPGWDGFGSLVLFGAGLMREPSGAAPP